MAKELRGLPGGANEYITHPDQFFSTEGYKRNSPDVNNPYNIIPSGRITMKGVDFPVLGVDNHGNKKLMSPGQEYQFPGDQVFEIPMAQKGGQPILNWFQKGGAPKKPFNPLPGLTRPTANTYDNTGRQVPVAPILPGERLKKHIRIAQQHQPEIDISDAEKRLRASEIAKNTPYGSDNKAELFAARNQAIGDKFRFSNDANFFDDYLNPGVMVGNMASGLANIPLNIKEENYLGAALDIANPLLLGRAMGSGSINPFGKKFWTNEVSNPEFINTFGMGIPKLMTKGLAAGIKVGAGIPISDSFVPRMPIEDVKALRQVQEIGRMHATDVPYGQQMKYALEHNLPEKHFNKIFNRTREDAQQLIDNGYIEEQAARSAGIRERIDLTRRPRQPLATGNPDYPDINRSTRVSEMIESFNQMPPPPEHLFLDLDEPITPTYTRSGRILIPGQERPRETMIQSLLTSFKETGLPDLKHNKSFKKFINSTISEYPVYDGNVAQKVPSLSLAGSGSLKKVSDKVSFVPEGMQSGDVFTGSTNTSHSSYLPQLKQVFKYDEGAPQFLGYKPMNGMGFLSNYHYENPDIAKYLNSEIDEQIKRRVIPKDILRPFVKDGEVMLPHYGIKQFQDGGESIWDNAHKQFAEGGETKIALNIYKDYVDGIYDGTPEENDARRVFNRLNTKHLNDARKQGMSPANYVMTNLLSLNKSAI